MTIQTDSPRLLLLHLAGADWRFIQPLLDAGRLPHFESIIDRGAMGDLSALPPLSTPASTISLATGQTAYAHGILHAIKADVDSAGGIRPVFNQDLTATTLWEYAAHAGLNTAAVGWPVSYPVTSSTTNNCLVVSDVFAQSQGQTSTQWPFDNASVSDSRLYETLASFRIHPNEMTSEMLAPLLGEKHQDHPAEDERIALLTTTIARSSTLHAVSTWIAEHKDWNLLAINFDFIERLSSAFLHYRAPRMKHVSQIDFDTYKDLIDNAYCYFDSLLGQYLKLIDTNSHIILASDHGYLPEHLRAPAGKTGAERVAINYREKGIFAVAGPGIKQDVLVYGTNQVDIFPTALTLLGVASPKALAGCVAQSALETPMEIIYADNLTIDRSHLALPSNEFSIKQIAELIALGYIAQPAKNAALAYTQTQVDWFSTLALTLMAKPDYTNAIVVLNKLLNIAPDHLEARYRIAQCYLATGEKELCRSTLDNLKVSGAESAMLDYLWGQLALLEEDTATAVTCFSRAERKVKDDMTGQQLLQNIGKALLNAHQINDAERVYRRSLQIDSNSVLTNNGLGTTLLVKKSFAEAVEYFQRSLGHLQNQPEVLMKLGFAQLALQQPHQAGEAFRKALELAPNYQDAKDGLAKTNRILAKNTVINISS